MRRPVAQIFRDVDGIPDAIIALHFPSQISPFFVEGSSVTFAERLGD
jgi:hypothetical protein